MPEFASVNFSESGRLTLQDCCFHAAEVEAGLCDAAAAEVLVKVVWLQSVFRFCLARNKR